MWYFLWPWHWRHHRHHGKHRYKLILETIVNNNFKTQIMGLTLNSGQQAVGTLGLQDTVTGNAVQAQFTGVTATPDNAAVYTATVNADGSISVAAVAPGSGTLSFSASVTYTDSNGQAQTATLTGTVAVSVAQAAADSVALVISFSAPTAIVTTPATPTA